MKVLIVGSGGREHTIAWKIAQSPKLGQLYIAPGNAGTASLGENIDIAATDLEALKEFVKENSIDLTIVGPEQPLVNGIIDAFQNENLPIFGPRQNAAQLEGSKAFAKDFMAKYGIPTAEYRTFTNHQSAVQYIRTIHTPITIKASGLAAGKGVLICESAEEAEDALYEIMQKKAFGDAGEAVVIEEFLVGEEISVIALTDGEHYQLLSPSQDHKPAYDGDRGPNTGGMGAYAPAPVATEEMMETVRSTIIKPTLQGMTSEGIPYKGFLYFGLMVTQDGPKVLEYNCRLGDPEAQVILPLMENDLLEVIQSILDGNFDDTIVSPASDYATCVIAASGGYPGKYSKGKAISGLDQDLPEYAQIFHAGTKGRDDEIVTDGGRVLGITCRGESLEESINRTYEVLKTIEFKGMQYRSDIGQKGLRYF